MSMHETNMSDEELLSALMDGELPADARERAFARLQADPELQRRWARYHAVRAALSTGAGRMSSDFAERVGRARAREPAVLVPGRVRGTARPWLRPVAGLAIAASVAVVAFAGLVLLRGPAPEAPLTVADSATQGLSGDGGSAPDDAVAPVVVSTDPAVLTEVQRVQLQRRMMLYLTSHSEYADVGDLPTMMPHGRLGSLNAGQ